MDKLVGGIQKYKREYFSQHQRFFESLVEGQSPRALFITCSDSRIDPNVLTQTEPGEIFTQRTAGNIVPPYGSVRGGEAATIEFAICALKVKHVIICGHSHCGAMAGLLHPERTKTMPAVQSYLEYAEATSRILNENYPDVTDEARRLKLAVEENVLVQLENLRTHPSVAAAVGRGALGLHGWVYKFETGDVTAFNPKTGQFLPVEQVEDNKIAKPPRVIE
jgi:carbonic anhydrase